MTWCLHKLLNFWQNKAKNPENIIYGNIKNMQWCAYIMIREVGWTFIVEFVEVWTFLQCGLWGWLQWPRLVRCLLRVYIQMTILQKVCQNINANTYTYSVSYTHIHAKISFCKLLLKEFKIKTAFKQFCVRNSVFIFSILLMSMNRMGCKVSFWKFVSREGELINCN